MAAVGKYTAYCSNLNGIKTHGAKDKTAAQDGLKGGEQASHRMVDNDLAELNKMKDCYYKVGEKYCIQPSVIAAIASRESRGGAVIRSTDGKEVGGGHGYGIMQVDLKSSGEGDEASKLAWDSCDLIDLAVGKILIKAIKDVSRDHPDWTENEKFKGGIAAYNFGARNVKTVKGIDVGTTGNDYSDDVIARAQHLVNQHGWD